MGIYRATLESLEQGMSIPAIAITHDRREDVIRGMIRSMVRDGLVAELRCDGESCPACPMADACGLATDPTKRYYVTETGSAFLRDEASSERSMTTDHGTSSEA